MSKDISEHTQTKKNGDGFAVEETMKLDLMDWKNVEASTEQSIRNAKVTVTLDSIMLEHAKKEIKKLGGKTSEEEKLEKVKKGNDKLE